LGILASANEAILVGVQDSEDWWEVLVASLWGFSGLSEKCNHLVDLGLGKDSFSLALRDWADLHEVVHEPETSGSNSSKSDVSESHSEVVVEEVIFDRGTICVNFTSLFVYSFVSLIIRIGIPPGKEVISGVTESESTNDGHQTSDHLEGEDLGTGKWIKDKTTRATNLDSSISLVHECPGFTVHIHRCN